MAFMPSQFPHLSFLQREDHEDNNGGEEAGRVNNHVEGHKRVEELRKKLFSIRALYINTGIKLSCSSCSFCGLINCEGENCKKKETPVIYLH